MSTAARTLRVYCIGLLAAFSLVLGACTPVRYHEIQPLSPTLAKQQSWRWEAPALSSSDGANAYLFDRELRQAISEGLSAKGYRFSSEKADLVLDYRISVVTRPNEDSDTYGPHWTQDNTGNFYFTGWEEPRGTGNMLQHGVVTLSVRSTASGELLWEGGASKLLPAGVERIDLGQAAHTAANTLLKKIPSHRL